MLTKLAISGLTVSLAIVLLLAALPMSVAQNQPGDGLKLPSDFPKDIPVYKNARLTKSGYWMDNPKAGKDFWFETADTVEAAIAFYKAQLPANGWTITKNSFVANPNTISVMKGAKMIMVSPNSVLGKNGSQVTRIEIILPGQ